MKAFKQGQRVQVGAVFCGYAIVSFDPVPGSVWRIRSDGTAFVRLDKRLDVPGAHGFPADASNDRGLMVIASPLDCTPAATPRAPQGMTMARKRREEFDSRFFCPTHMDGHQRVAVEFSFHRTITRQDDGQWKAEAPEFGVSLVRPNPLHADFALTAEVKRLAVEMLTHAADSDRTR